MTSLTGTSDCRNASSVSLLKAARPVSIASSNSMSTEPISRSAEISLKKDAVHLRTSLQLLVETLNAVRGTRSFFRTMASSIPSIV